MKHAQIVALLTAPTPPGVVRLFRVDDRQYTPPWGDLPCPGWDKCPIEIGPGSAGREGWKCATDTRDLAKWWPEYDLQRARVLGAIPVLVEVPREYCHDCGTQWCYDPKHARTQVLQ